MAATCHLAFVIRVSVPPTKSISCICQRAKFGWIRCSSFDNMQVLILCALSMKCVFTPQNRGFGHFTPPPHLELWYQRDPKTALSFAETRRITYIHR